MSGPLSRRGIVGMLGLLAASPRAVESQIVEAVNERLHGAGAVLGPPLNSPTRAMEPAQSAPALGLEQLAMKHLAREANRERRRRENAIYACRSTSAAFKRAASRDARQGHQSASLKLAQALGWRAANDDFDEWD